MSAYAELSAAGWSELFLDIGSLGPKTGIGWLRMSAQLKRFGSIPADERSVASILGVSLKFLRERAWPLIEVRLQVSEDGRRYTCPDIAPSGGRARAPAPKPAAEPSKEDSQQKKAAVARWAKQRQRDAEAHARAHPETHTERMRPDAETHDNSVRGASETHAENASDAHTDASDVARPDSLSKGDSTSDSQENPGLERESADAGADAAGCASDAPADAPRMQSNASADAPADASEPPKKGSTRAISRLLPDDWAPSGAARAEAERIGADLEAEAAKFRNVSSSSGTKSFNWDASFMVWLRRFAEYTERQRKIPLVQTLQGGKAETLAAEPEGDIDPAAAKLKETFGGTNYRSWLRHMTIGEVDENGEVTVTLPTPFQRDHIKKNFADRLAALWKAENPDIRRVNFIAAASERRAADG